MKDFEIEEIIQNIDASIPSSLEDKILCQSSKAFKRSYIIKKITRRSVTTLAIALICFSFFIAGQFTERKNLDNLRHANMANQDTVTITVHQDFLEWINAGHFFAQIDMKDKAAEAFGKAVDLVPKEQLSLALQGNNIIEKEFYESTENTEFQGLNVMAMADPEF